MESESDPLTRRAVDLFEKEPLKGNSEVHLHTPTKFGEDRSKDLGGDREQTDRQTNRQTDKRCSIYSMICLLNFYKQHDLISTSTYSRTRHHKVWKCLFISFLIFHNFLMHYSGAHIQTSTHTNNRSKHHYRLTFPCKEETHLHLLSCSFSLRG